MTELIIHPAQQIQIDALKKNLPQSLLLTGDLGVGLFTIASSLGGRFISHLLFPQTAKGESGPSGTIAIETIRELYEQTRTKVTTRQIVIIDDADRLSLGAQNAFLKLLEEPNQNVHFTLTSHNPTRLLPTIRSRTRTLYIQPATHQQSIDYIASLKVPAELQTKLLFIADGLPAELYRLHNSEEYFKKRAGLMTDARDMLTMDRYAAFVLLQKYLSDRGAAIQLVESMALIARRSVSTKPQIKLIKELEKLLDIREKLEANHSVRLQLIRHVL